MKRRNFLKNSLITAGALSLGKYAYANDLNPQNPASANVRKPIPEYGDALSDHMTAYIYDSQQSAVWVRWKSAVLTCYRAEFFQKYPYFYPLRALKSGLSLVMETGQPWPHHRGVFFGADRVNGRNYWQNNPDKDRIVSKKIELGVCIERSAEILNDCLWIPFEGEPIISDKRRFEINILNDETYTLDSFIELTALTEVIFERTNHGFFGVRTEHDLSVDGGGVLINSEGQQLQANTLDKPARWVAAYGKRAGRDDGLVEGVAIMSPAYKRSPFDRSVWFTRDYGNFSPHPFNAFARDEKFILPKGDRLQLAYRIVAFTGTPTNSFLNAQWEEFNRLSEGKRS
jgi:hypothetical protein